MTTEEALDFLRRHQPMPDDEMLSEEIINEYDQVRKHFLDISDERCIPLFLNSFGEGDGFGVYQLVEDVFRKYPPSKVVAHLETALADPKRSVRYWAAEIAANFPDEQLVPSLQALLDEDNEDLVAASVIALGQIESREAKSAIQSALDRSPSPHLRDLMREQLEP